MSARISARIACIGGAHVDRTARALGPVAMGSSNPVTMADSIGGVGCNVARVAARLGAQVAFVGLVGDDADGRAVRRALKAEGVDTSALAVTAEAPTASYTAFLDQAGELVVALADMAIYDRATPDMVEKARPCLDACPIWFADANLPRETLAALSGLFAERKSDGILAFDAVSVAKAPRLADLPCGILFLNAAEARALYPGLRFADVVEPVLGTAPRIPHDTVMSFGALGCVVRDGLSLFAMPPAPTRVVDVTGTGDALIAGTLVGHARHEHLEGATHVSVLEGLAAAAIVAQGAGSLPDGLNVAAAQARKVGDGSAAFVTPGGPGVAGLSPDDEELAPYRMAYEKAT